MTKYVSPLIYTIVVGSSFAACFWMTKREYPLATQQILISGALGGLIGASIVSAIVPFVIFALARFRKSSLRVVGGTWLVLLIVFSGFMLYGSKPIAPAGSQHGVVSDQAGIEFMMYCLKSAESTLPFSAWSPLYRNEYCMCAASKSRVATAPEDYPDIDKRGYLNLEQMQRIIVGPATKCAQEMASEHAELRPARTGGINP